MKTVDELAREVLDGKWGSGDTRKKRLTEAGYDYNAVQKKVNAIIEDFSNEKLAMEVLSGIWGSGDNRKAKLEKAGHNYNAVQAKVNQFVKTVRSRADAMKSWFDACKAQEQWSYNARYNWGQWVRTGKNIEASKNYGTCIVYPSVVAMRCKLIKETRYVTASGEPDASQKDLDEFWDYSVGSMSSINRKYWRAIKYPKNSAKTLNELIKTGDVVTGDIIGFIEHTTMYVGKDKNGNLLFNNAGHAAGIGGSAPGSNRAVLNQKCKYGNKKVLGVFSPNTFGVITSCSGGTITATNLYMAGQDVKITIKPNNGYVVKSIRVDNKEVKNATSYTFSKIDDHHKVEVVCEKGSSPSPTPKKYTGKLPTYKLVKSNAQVIEDTIKWAKWIISDNRFHYGYGTHAHHNGCYFCKTQYMKKNRTPAILDPDFTYCCNPFVGAAWAHGGCVPTAMNKCRNTDSWDFSKGHGYDASSLFDKLGHPKKNTLKPGDVLCNGSHVALYVGDGKIAEASSGDDNVRNSTKWNNSIRLSTLSDSRYNGFERVYRYNGSVNTSMPLRHGEVSSRVKDMQEFINWYYNGAFFKECGGADGYYGDNTLKWVAKFQVEKFGKGEGDGIVGPKTIEAMEKCTV